MLHLNDAIAFANAIRELSASPERCRQFGEFNRKRVENYFIDRCAARYEAVLQRAIDARGARKPG